jgi:subtilisin family serine protease
MAIPYVSGVAALIKAQYPTLTQLQIKARLLNNTDYLTSLEGKTVSEGRLNAFGAAETPWDILTAMIFISH